MKTPSSQTRQSRLKSDSTRKDSNTLSLQSDQMKKVDILASLSPSERQHYLRQLSGSQEVPYNMEYLGGNLSDVSSGYCSQSTYSSGDRTFGTFIPKEEAKKGQTNDAFTNGVTKRTPYDDDEPSSHISKPKPDRVLSSTSC